jgi:hypothetical protein
MEEMPPLAFSFQQEAVEMVLGYSLTKKGKKMSKIH